MLVTAGPGSGKTTVLTLRIQQLCRRCSPEKICVITFARKAAREMEERFSRLTDAETAGKVCFGTFHSVFFRWLRQWGEIQPHTRIFSDDEKKIWLSRIGRDVSREASLSFCQWDDALKQQYLQYKKKKHYIDFDDIIARMDQVIGRHEVWRDYRYFLIDEFQDIDDVQYRIVRQMAGPKANLFVVGDEDQSIYAFRGSRPDLFLQFPLDFPGCRTVSLGENFRCSAEITACASRLIEHNKVRTKKILHAAKGPCGEPVRLLICRTETGEYRNMVKVLRHHHAAYSLAYSEMAVLCRTREELSEAYAALREACVPARAVCASELRRSRHFLNVWDELYSVYRLTRKIPQRKDLLEAGKVFPLLMEAADSPSAGTKPVWEIVRSLPAKDLEHRSSVRELSDILEKAGKKNARHGVRYLLLETDYLAALLKKADQTGCPYRYVLRQIRRILDPRMCIGSDRVWVMTMHAAKGLEFPYVWIPGLTQGRCPRTEALQLEASGQGNTKLEEERRLFYVAMTRAEKYLNLSYACQGNQFQKSIDGGLPGRDLPGGASEFLKQTGLYDIMIRT